MKTTLRVRAHRRCHCGSKKKYRNCCGKASTIKFEDLSSEAQNLFRESKLKHTIATKYHTNHFGNVAEINSCIFNGRRMVCLGGSIVTSDNPQHEWDTPAQFLSSHLKTTFGNEWFEEQINKDKSEQHILIQWCLEAKMPIDNENLELTQLNGSALSYLHIAYDLFVLRNQNCLTDRLINRLKDQNNFNGARYELFVLATMIRAGFGLKMHDETLGKNKVAECQATHLETHTKIEVEAKARHVRGTYGSKHGKKTNFNLYTKCLKPAIEKNIRKPFIIFVDINLPELEVFNDREKLDKVKKEYDKLQEKYTNKLPNIVCFTNIPFHYAREDFTDKNNAYGLIVAKSPRVKLKNQNKVIAAIQDSLSKYAYLPAEFNESEHFANLVFKKTDFPL